MRARHGLRRDCYTRAYRICICTSEFASSSALDESRQPCVTKISLQTLPRYSSIYLSICKPCIYLHREPSNIALHSQLQYCTHPKDCPRSPFLFPMLSVFLSGSFYALPCIIAIDVTYNCYIATAPPIISRRLHIPQARCKG